MVPLELSVKLTVSGLRPLVGLPLKLAAGATAPVPVRALVLLPALAVLKTTTLLKLAALPGAKLTTRLVEPKPARLKGVPETIVKGPPLLVKTTTLLKLPALAGLKATCTWPVWPGGRLKGLPPAMAKGSVALTAPVRVRPPPLTTWKLSVLVWPITTAPKSRLAGLSANNGGGLVTTM